MGRPRNSDRQEPIQQRILRVATDLFAEHGYQKTSLAAIARATEIKAPSLLYHFGSKEGLYTEVVRAFYAELTATWEQTLDAGAGPAELLEVLRSLRQLDQRKQDLLVTIVTELMRDGRAADVIEHAVVPILDRLTRGLDDLTGGGRPTRQIISLLIIAFVMNLNASRTLPAVDRLRSAMWGDQDHLDQLAAMLLRAD